MDLKDLKDLKGLTASLEKFRQRKPKNSQPESWLREYICSRTMKYLLHLRLELADDLTFREMLRPAFNLIS